MKRLAASAVLLLIVSSSGLAAADEPKPPGQATQAPRKVGADEADRKLKQQRQVLFDEGQKLIEQGQPKEALRKFHEVYRLRAHPRVLLWIALSEDQLGHLVQAKSLYEQAAADAHDTKQDDVEREATTSLAELSPRIPRIAITITPPGDADVLIDAARGVLKGGRAGVNPGKHTVVVRAPGRKSFEAEVDIKAGEEKSLLAFLPPASIEPAPRASSAAPRESGVPVGAVVTGIAGGTFVLVGGIFVGMGYGAPSQVFKTAGAAFLIGGGLALAGGIAWGIVGSKSARAAPAVRSSRLPGVSLAVSAAPLPGGAALGVKVRF